MRSCPTAKRDAEATNKLRTGRKDGRTLYNDDQLLGMMDTAPLAQRVADTMNGDALLNDAASIVEALAVWCRKLEYMDMSYRADLFTYYTMRAREWERKRDAK